MADFKGLLYKLNKHLNILNERKAKYAGNAPLELLNQIEDHEQAISLTRQVITGELSEAEWREALQPLLIADTEQTGDAGQPRIPLQRPPRAEHFTGREQELAQLLADLQPGRVVTLCGPGGIGKSALAAEAAWQLPPDRFPDGIISYNFHNQAQAALALEQIALSFAEEPRPTPRDAARRALSGRQALLLLDSAEKADDLSAVLEVAGNCGVLVTSRQRKDAMGERQDLQPLLSDEAVTLLRKWSGGHMGDAETAASICQLVGQLPVAVRLAGRYMAETDETAAEYLEWLKETPLDALNQGQRRLDSVPLLLKESIAQVGKTARRLLSTVAVLALAPFSPEPVSAALGLAKGQMRLPLGELVGYGLLLRRGERYEVSHPLIHTYAREKVPPEAEMMEQLAKYYIVLFEAESNKGMAGYQRLAAERAHVMQVLTRCAEQGEGETVRRLVAAVRDYLRIQGHWTELVTALEMGVNATTRLGQRREEAAFLGNLGATCHALGQVTPAIAHYNQALTITREIGDRHGEATQLGGLGHAYRDQGEVKRAIEHLEQALIIAREIGDRHGEERYLDGLGSAHNALGHVHGDEHHPGMIEYYQQALAIARELGDRHREGIMLGNLALAYRTLGQLHGDSDYPGAIEYYQKALIIARELGDRRNEGAWLGALGAAYRAQGETQQAIRQHYEPALRIACEIGDRHSEGVWLGNLGFAYRDLGETQQAIEHFEQALAIFHQIGDRRHATYWLFGLGQTYLDLGEVDRAIKEFEQTLTIAREVGDRHAEANGLGGLGDAYLALGQAQRAIETYEQALTIAREIGLRAHEADWLYGLGLTYRSLEQEAQAQHYFEQSLTILEEIGSSKTARVRRLLAEVEG